MALLMLFGDGIGTLAYALVADYAKAHFTGEVARTQFYNDLDLATNLLGAVLQLSVTRWLLVRHGAGWGLVVPSLVNVVLLVALVAVGASSSLILFGASVPLLALMMIVTRGFAYGMTKPATDALYTRVPRETRYKGKNFVETAVWRFGDVVVTSAVSGLRMLGWSVGGMALIGAGVATLATVVARRAGWSPDLLPDECALVGDEKTSRT
jgi:AAA family ATP:ADP antiporter